MSGVILLLPNTPSWRGAQFKKHRDNFTFTFTLNEDNVVVYVVHAVAMLVIIVGFRNLKGYQDGAASKDFHENQLIKFWNIDVRN
jgi:hypothetical protein